ncbi:MAG: type II secretion system ATPase GspE [Rhizomicrobium sp.]|nr:type II secretion system ATPase GspE [Rhizomicrobium sp.]
MLRLSETSQPIEAHSPTASFAEYLVSTGTIFRDALQRAQHVSESSGERLETVLTRLGIITEVQRTEAIAHFLGLAIVSTKDYPQTPILEETFSAAFLQEAQFVPLEVRDDGVAVAFANPLDTYTVSAVAFAVNKPVICYVAYPSDIEAAKKRLYRSYTVQDDGVADAARHQAVLGFADDVDRLKDLSSDAPVIKLVNGLIDKAVEARASDIHIEPMQNELRVRYRIDGVLQNVASPPHQLASAVISRVKIMTKLNIAERRLPQDGRISLAVRGREIDIRVSTTPASHGESIVLRILDREQVKLDFAALGFDPETIAQLRSLLTDPHGILLVTGPTGSGKTTTLYAALTELNNVEKKILTIEDPIEYHLGGITQVQVKPTIGLTFAGALRSFLRQDPDIMMVGEIRDLETAQVAVQAALTGHLILSTLHTNDAASALTRLIDMGVEDYLLTSTINGVIAQRLVRTLCPACREAYRPVAGLWERLGITPAPTAPLLYRAKGCPACNQTGFRGRTAIIEILPISDGVREALLKSANASAIQEIAVQQGMETIRAAGIKKALAGVTTVEEVLRATRAG